MRLTTRKNTTSVRILQQLETLQIKKDSRRTFKAKKQLTHLLCFTATFVALNFYEVISDFRNDEKNSQMHANVMTFRMWTN